MSILTDWQNQHLANTSLAGTLLLPSDDAWRTFLAEQGLNPTNIYLQSQQLESLLAYHTLPQPLSYADLARAGVANTPLPTELPGATLRAQPINSTTQVLPYSQAVGGLAGSSSGGGASAAITGAGPAGDAVSAALAAGGTGAATTLPGLTGLGQAPAGQQQQCFRSIADAIAATPSLSIVRSTLSLSGWNLTNPGLNITLFLVSDTAQQQGLAQLFAPGQEEIQKLIGEAARDTRLLHASVAYTMVAGGYGGLTVDELRQLEGEELPTVFSPHMLTVEADPDNPEGVALLPEYGNLTAIVGREIRTCGGSVIHQVDRSLSPRTPVVDQYEAGAPLSTLNLTAGYEDYSPAEAQAEVDATAPAGAAAAPPTGLTAGGGGVAASPQFFSRASQLLGQFGWALLLNKQALEALAAYHIVPEAMRTTQMSEGQQLKTLAKDAQGTTLSLTVHRGSAGGVGISLQAVGSTARLLVPDVPICGGYAQVIDQVLLPVAVNATNSAPGGPAAPPPPSGSAASG
ncbi:hypothetical protein COHA_009614 [Chlorella ohadii]|uniref:FAS1 domain-containing protein n=1 Tax=Chlorella ohadii TaxID=2649997 RepID=A0AAD5DHH4_9CHLO|nr:hypothetical protein COHA_009614 [Chlorella ohadii]